LEIGKPLSAEICRAIFSIVVLAQALDNKNDGIWGTKEKGASQHPMNILFKGLLQTYS
jgi:hypothetical protein